MVFYIGGKTQEEWVNRLYSEFSKPKYTTKLAREEQTDNCIKFPIEFTIDSIFHTLERYKSSPYQQYQLALGFSNAVSCTAETFHKNKASFIESHDSLRQIYLKDHDMVKYFAEVYDVDLPDYSEKYLDYISHVIDVTSQTTAGEFQQRDVAIEVKEEHQRQYRENLNKMSNVERVLKQRGDDTTKKPSVTWSETIRKTHSFNPDSPIIPSKKRMKLSIPKDSSDSTRGGNGAGL
jgi:hypothetical protein